MAAKYCLPGGYARSRLEVRRQNTRAIAGLFADRGHRDGLVHRRNYFAVHGYALGAAEASCQQYFPEENPVGRTILVLDQNNADYEIIGVVGDTPWQVGQPIRPIMYFPLLGGDSEDGQSLAIRTDSDPLAMSVPVQKQIAALDPELPVSNVMTMQQAVGDSLGNARFSAALVLGFAVLSLVLASVGLYGVLSYLMAQRATELGVRMALGAQRGQLLRLILFDGMRPAILGLALGSAASAGITQLIRSMLYDTRPLDPAVYVAVTCTLLMVATLACMLPAWRASRLDPMQALRAE